MTRLLTFDRLKWLSFTHSAVYIGLLVFWAIPGEQAVEPAFGWGHGVGWIVIRNSGEWPGVPDRSRTVTVPVASNKSA